MKLKSLLLSVVIVLALSLCAFPASRPLVRSENYISSGIATSHNILLFGDSVGQFYSDGPTAATSWHYDAGGTSITGVPAITDRLVVFAQLDGVITCLNVSDGSLVWRYSQGHSDSFNDGLSDGVFVGGGKVYASFNDGTLRALDIDSGRVVWTYKAEQGLRTAPLYNDGLVLVGEYNGLFSMIDAETGERVNGGGAGGAVNTPVVHKGNVYYSAADGSVNAVQIRDVIPQWNSNVKEPIMTSPAVNDSMVVVQTASGKVIALDIKDGAKLWEYDSQGGDSGVRPVITNGKVIVATGDNRILTLNAKSGRLTNEIGDASGLRGDPLYTGARMYFLVGGHDLYMVD